MVKWPELEADHSLLCRTWVKNEWSYTSNPSFVPLWHGWGQLGFFVNFEDLVPFLSTFCHLWNVCLMIIFHQYKHAVIARRCPAQCVGWSNTLDLKKLVLQKQPQFQME